MKTEFEAFAYNYFRDELPLEDDPGYRKFVRSIDRYGENQLAKLKNHELLGPQATVELDRELPIVSDLEQQDTLGVTGSEPGISKPQVRRHIRHRGPRAAAEPTGDIKLRLGAANEAFQGNSLDDAMDLVDDIIRLNAETYEAWILKSSIFHEVGKRQEALNALVFAAHLRPKHKEAWFNCGDYALDSVGEVTEELLKTALWCFRLAVRNLPTNAEARCRKAQVSALLGNYTQAAREYEYVLRLSPNDIIVIRELAILYIDLKRYTEGKKLYEQTFDFFRASPDAEKYQEQVSWTDLDNYAVLCSFLDQNEETLMLLNLLSRWLMGREEENFWDRKNQVDCEWDDGDVRRSHIPDYSAGRFPISCYGSGLPIELHVHFGKFKLKLGHHDAAMVG